MPPPDLNSIAELWTIVPAAGQGSRMGADTRKQYLRLGDLAVLEQTVARLRAASISRIVIPVAPDDDGWRELSFAGSPPEFIEGGTTRAESVLRGVEFVARHVAPGNWVMVHDGVRPCVRPDEIQLLVDAITGSEVGGLLATRVTDTLKIAELPGAGTEKRGREVVESTPDRLRYWQAQTPQIFRLGMLREALQLALERGVQITDEAAAVEMLGHSPLLVEGRSDNIKITLKDDLALAAFFRSRQDDESAQHVPVQE